MSKIGIIGAMDVEVETLKAQMEQVQTEEISRMTFYSGILWGCEVVVAVSGIGKVNSAMCAQTMILKYSPDIIINTGVAGGHASLEVCDTVIATKVVQHDCDSTATGDPSGLIWGVDLVYLPCADEVVQRLTAAAERLGKKFHTGVIASGDQFIASSEKSAWISETFGAAAYEMEGASIGQVCYINGVDFAVVRIISDNGNEESHIDFPKFTQIAVKESVELLKEFLTGVKA